MMAGKKDISVEEWIAALEGLGAKRAAGMSIAELSEAWGVGDVATRSRVKAMIKAGRACCNGRREELNICRVRHPVPVYSLLAKKGKP